MRFLTTLCCLALIAAAAPLSAQDGPKKPSKEDIERIRKLLSGNKKEAEPLTKNKELPPAKIDPAANKRKPGVRGARYPIASPDGTQMAFALHGDLWTMPIDGGRATRVYRNRRDFGNGR